MSIPQPNRELLIVTACGVGMGTSLILKMTVEDALKEMGLEARVEHTDLGTLKGMRPDIVVAQEMHASEVRGTGPEVVSIKNFLSKEEVKAGLEVAIGHLQAAGKA
jgi:ascorbate PTS system EIIB component